MGTVIARPARSGVRHGPSDHQRLPGRWAAQGVRPGPELGRERIRMERMRGRNVNRIDTVVVAKRPDITRNLNRRAIE